MSINDPDLRPPLLKVTPDDHGAWVIVASSLFIIITVLVVAVTLFSRVKVLRTLSWSDICLCLATIFAFPQAICICHAASSGLGRHRDALDELSFERYSKLFYAGQILAILSLACSKASITLLIISIKPLKAVLLACRVVLGVTAAWAVAAVISLAVQCDPPTPWDSTPGRCIDQQALYIGLNVGNILIDLAIVILPFLLVWNVKLPTAKRAQISSLFSLRIVVPICTIIYLVNLHPYFHSTPVDKPWHGLKPTIWYQAMLSLSIITACIPSLRRVLADLQTGMMAGTVSQFFELSVSGGNGANYGVYGSGSRTGGSKAGYGGRSPMQSAKDNTSVSQSRGERDTELRFDFGNSKRSMVNKGPRERSDSVKNLRENAIIQTIDYEVRYEGESDGRRHHRASSSGHDASSYGSDGWSYDRATSRK